MVKPFQNQIQLSVDLHLQMLDFRKSPVESLHRSGELVNVFDQLRGRAANEVRQHHLHSFTL
jgi:hypothetical protein